MQLYIYFRNTSFKYACSQYAEWKLSQLCISPEVEEGRLMWLNGLLYHQLHQQALVLYLAPHLGYRVSRVVLHSAKQYSAKSGMNSTFNPDHFLACHNHRT